MLVLSRRTGESLLIGEDVEVVILSFDGRAVKVGIRAPKQVRIMRKEIQEVAAQNATAAAMPGEERLQNALSAVHDALLRRTRG